ncbi:hypothetical protein D3C72_1448100 [compost metagenome]
MRQQRPAHAQRFPPQIPSADERQIEGVEDDGLGPFAIERVLQGLEAGYAAIVQNDDFPVDPGPLGGQPAEGFDQMRQLRAPVMAIAGVEAHVVAVDADHQPVAVELHFIQPVFGVARHAVHQGGQLRLEQLGQFGRLAGQRVRLGLRLGRLGRLGHLPPSGLVRASRRASQRHHTVGHLVHDAEFALRARVVVPVLDQ